MERLTDGFGLKNMKSAVCSTECINQEEAGHGCKNCPVAIAIVKLRYYEGLDEQGRLVVLDERTSLAMCAGARSINKNRRLFGVRYSYDVFDNKTISYAEAAVVLGEIGRRYLHRRDVEPFDAAEEASRRG